MDSRLADLDLNALLIRGVVDYAIYMIDPDGYVVSWNPGAERIKGYSHDEIIGRHFSMFYTRADRELRKPWQGLENARLNGRHEAEGWRVRKDGSKFWAMVVIDAIRSDTGELLGFAKITRDITERHEAQVALEESRDQLFQAQKMEAVGQLTVGLAHDFNNILAGISSSLEFLGAKILQGKFSDLDRYLAMAQSMVVRGAALSHRLLALARQHVVDPRPTNANALISSLVDLVRGTAGSAIHIESVLSIGLWSVICDPNQLESALLNLCINARDSMPDGGTITIRTGNSWIDNFLARQKHVEPGPYVAMSVTDTGTGMPPEVVERAFDPFFTTKAPGAGSGLGLAMVYGFARQANGTAVIHSQPGRGTEVCLYLPRHDGEGMAEQSGEVLDAAD